jgi:hypothetical protein
MISISATVNDRERTMANVCQTKIAVIGLNEPAEAFVKALSKAMFGVDLDNLNPKQWGEDENVVDAASASCFGRMCIG